MLKKRLLLHVRCLWSRVWLSRLSKWKLSRSNRTGSGSARRRVGHDWLRRMGLGGRRRLVQTSHRTGAMIWWLCRDDVVKLIVHYKIKMNDALLFVLGSKLKCELLAKPNTTPVSVVTREVSAGCFVSVPAFCSTLRLFSRVPAFPGDTGFGGQVCLIPATARSLSQLRTIWGWGATWPRNKCQILISSYKSTQYNSWSKKIQTSGPTWHCTLFALLFHSFSHPQPLLSSLFLVMCPLGLLPAALCSAASAFLSVPKGKWPGGWLS